MRTKQILNVFERMRFFRNIGVGFANTFALYMESRHVLEMLLKDETTLTHAQAIQTAVMVGLMNYLYYGTSLTDKLEKYIINRQSIPERQPTHQQTEEKFSENRTIEMRSKSNLELEEARQRFEEKLKKEMLQHQNALKLQRASGNEPELETNTQSGEKKAGENKSNAQIEKKTEPSKTKSAENPNSIMSRKISKWEVAQDNELNIANGNRAVRVARR